MRREEEVAVEQRGGRVRLHREAWGKKGEKQHMAEKEAKEGLCRQSFQSRPSSLWRPLREDREIVTRVRSKSKFCVCLVFLLQRFHVLGGVFVDSLPAELVHPVTAECEINISKSSQMWVRSNS